MKRERGFILWIIVAIIALAALKFFLNWDIFDAAASDQGKSTIEYVRTIVNIVWGVIAVPVTFVWSKIIWPLLAIAWDSLQMLIEKGRGVPISVGVPGL